MVIIRKIVLFLAFMHGSVLSHAQLFPNLGGQRVGISAISFLNNDISPRSIGMAGYNITLGMDGYSMFTNPAAMADATAPVVAASNLQMLRDIQNTYVSTLIPVTKEGVLGVSVQNLSTGRMETRTEFQPNGTGQFFYVANTAIGLGYAKRLSRMFSFGVNVKYVYEQLADFTAHTAVTDLGFLYQTDYKELKFAAFVQNFGFNSSLSGNRQEIPVTYNRRNFSLENNPAATVFKFGASIVPYRDERHSIMTGLQLNHPNDDAENLRFGVEYAYYDILYLRTGIKANVLGERFPTGGLGLKVPFGRHQIIIDYGANPTVYLGVQHCLGITFKFNQDERE